MPNRTKKAGAIVHLVEELGDARLRCEQLVAYIAEAVRLIENSPHKDHFFEVAGHILYAAPLTLQKLQKSLQAVALAANQIDSEELKNDLRPEKVQELEKALENVRIRQIRRRSEPTMITPQYVAEKLRQFAATTRKYQLPQSEMAQFIVALEEGHKQANESVPVADMLDSFAQIAERGNKDYLRLATVLRRMIGDVHVKGVVADVQGTRTAGAAEATKFQDLAKKQLPSLVKEGRSVDVWLSTVDTTMGKLLDLLAHDKWAKDRILRVMDDSRDLKATATKFRATLANFRKVVEQNYLSLAQSVNPDEAKTEPEWAEYQSRSASDAWKTDRAKTAAFDLDRALAQVKRKLHLEVIAPLKGLSRLIDDGVFTREQGEPEQNFKIPGYVNDVLKSATELMEDLANIDNWASRSASDEDKQSRFEEGKPADPTKNMSPEDAKKWKVENEKHKDDFKKEAYDAWKARSASDEFNLESLKASLVLMDSLTKKAISEATKPSPNMKILGVRLGGLIMHVADALNALGIREHEGVLLRIGAAVKREVSGLGKEAGAEAWKARSASDEDKQSRFEEGKPADPTKNMSPEDAEKWKAENEKHKDDFKKNAASASELKEMQMLLKENGYDPKDAKKLQGEGIGTYELEHRLKEVGGLERTHGLKKKTASIMEGFKPDPDWLEGVHKAGRRNYDAIQAWKADNAK